MRFVGQYYGQHCAWQGESNPLLIMYRVRTSSHQMIAPWPCLRSQQQCPLILPYQPSSPAESLQPGLTSGRLHGVWS